MARIGHFDEHCLDHRQVRSDRAAIVEEARIIHPALLVVDVFLAQCPADALGSAALDLTLDVARMDRLADILERRVALDRDVAGLHVHADIAEMRAEAWPGTLRIQRYLGVDRAARARGLQCDRTQFQRIEFTCVGPCGKRLAVAPFDRLDRDFPDHRGAFL